MIDVTLSRIVVRDGSDRQYIFLSEVEGSRGFPIVIGNNEAGEIQRVVHGVEPERPLTHQLTFSAIGALGGRLQAVEIVDLKQNTFFAQVVLEGGPEGVVRVDARPSDAIALALRARCPIRVAEEVLTKASDTKSSP
jgi:bifunctional DNase/RNase